MAILNTKMEIKSWDEKPYRELADGTRYTRAEVVLAGDDFGEGTFDALMYYHQDGTSTYVTLMSLTGTLAGRHGGLVLAGEGTFDGTTARGASRVVEATGELAGLTGGATSASTHADYPYMPLRLEYELG